VKTYSAKGKRLVCMHSLSSLKKHSRQQLNDSTLQLVLTWFDDYILFNMESIHTVNTLTL